VDHLGAAVRKAVTLANAVSKRGMSPKIIPDTAA
jgi:hypothetical protein